ncbi:MFS transporter [Gordonia hydrophobica]|uniref:MFS transporter n=1 Tax=Gordonia hydrophobica TaxID=40516 RepID=A0ABZ2U1C8_9ACTN|nr:MFS transporter [Gordonia hydrophobica]MBM7368456.1 NNP family nitrate/nitrite transporter-like MFS transporter [Gordonia hydrophobica]
MAVGRGRRDAGRARTITDWDPEDTLAWENGGAKVARRNLVWSVIAEHIGFSVWTLWSVMVLFMPTDVYGITAGDKFLIGAVATLSGAALRFPYTLATTRFGGRNWTIASALILVVPVVATILLLANPGQPLWMYLVCAALTGFGGGNFASSMTNINAFYPQRLKGWALGLNAGGGNLGVPAVQLVGLLVIAWAGDRQPYWVCAVYLLLLAVAAVGAALFMDNLEGPGVDVASMRAALVDRDTWLISLLYIGTFGSFIGFSFAFSQVLALSFLDDGQTQAQAVLHAAQIAFLGPLLGSIARIYGGRLADRVGGSRVTLGAFIGMVGAAGVVLVGDSIAVQTVGFVALFVLSGMGNGSVYKIIPSVYEAKARSLPSGGLEPVAYSRAMSGAVIGIAGAIGGLGGVGINLVLRQSYQQSGGATAAIIVFAVFYLVAALVTWRVYVVVPRPGAEHVPAEPVSAKLSS